MELEASFISPLLIFRWLEQIARLRSGKGVECYSYKA